MPTDIEDTDDDASQPAGLQGSFQQYTTPEARQKALQYLTEYDTGMRSPEAETLRSRMDANAESARKVLRDARQRLLSRQYDPGHTQALLAIGAGMSQPSNYGFSGSLGNVAKELQPIVQNTNQFGLDKDKQLLELNSALQGVDTSQLSEQLKELQVRQQERARMAEKSLGILGKEIRPAGAAGIGPMSTIEKNVRGMGFTPGTPEFSAQVKKLVDTDVANKRANAGLDENPDTPEQKQNVAYQLGVPMPAIDPYSSYSTKTRAKMMDKDRTQAEKDLAKRNAETDKIRQSLQEIKDSMAFNEHTNTSGWFGVARKLSLPLPYIGDAGKALGDLIYNVGGVGDEASAMDKLQLGEARSRRLPGERWGIQDQRMLLDTAIGRDKPYLTNKYLGLGMITANQIALDHTQFLNDYYLAHGHLQGAENYWQKYLDDNPIFDPKKSRMPDKVGNNAFPVLNKDRVDYKTYFRRKMEIPAGEGEPEPEPEDSEPPPPQATVAPVKRDKPLIRKIPGYAEGGQVNVEPMGFLHGLTNEVFQGGTLGLSDELGGESSHDRARLEDFSNSSPRATVAGQYAGAVASSLAAQVGLKRLAQSGGKSGRAAAALLALASKYPMLSRTAAGGAAGAIGGVAAGDDRTGRVGPAISGASIGMLLSPLGSMAAKYALRGGRRAFPGGAPIADAEQRVIQSLNNDKIDLGSLADRRAQDVKAGIPTSLSDLGGKYTEGLTQGVLKHPGPDTDALGASLATRQQGNRDRTLEAVNKGLKPDDYFSQEDKLLSDLHTNSKPLYQEAFDEAPDIQSEAYKRLAQTQEGQSAIDFAKKRFQLDLSKEGVTKVADPMKQLSEAKSKEELDRISQSLGLFESDPTPASEPLETAYVNLRQKLPSSGDLPPEPPKGKSLEFMNYVKQGLDSQVEKAYRSGDSNLARLLREHRDALLGDLDNVSPTYGKARQQWGSDLEVSNALKSGRNDFGSMAPGELAKNWRDMSFSAKDAFRSGAAQSILEKLTDPSSSTNYAQKVIGSPAMMDKLKIMFDKPSEFTAFEAALKRESELFQSSKGSLTASKRNLETGTPEPGNLFSSIFRLVARPGGMGDATANHVAKLLNTSDPREIKKLQTTLTTSSKTMAARKAAENAASMAGAVGAGAVTMPNPRGYMYAPEEEQP